MIGEDHGGAGLDAFDAMLVLGECGRVLAGIGLLGHLPATAILGDSPCAAELMPDLASGERRAAYLPAQPPGDLDQSWSTDPASGAARAPLPSAGAAGDDGRVPLTGSFAFVPDAPGADTLVGVAIRDGRAVGVAIGADAPGVKIEPVTRYDSTRSLGHVTLEDAPAIVLDAPERVPRRAPGISRRR